MLVNAAKTYTKCHSNALCLQSIFLKIVSQHLCYRFCMFKQWENIPDAPKVSAQYQVALECGNQSQREAVD